jgi:hypothetical protein
MACAERDAVRHQVRENDEKQYDACSCVDHVHGSVPEARRCGWLQAMCPMRGQRSIAH